MQDIDDCALAAKASSAISLGVSFFLRVLCDLLSFTCLGDDAAILSPLPIRFATSDSATGLASFLTLSLHFLDLGSPSYFVSLPRRSAIASSPSANPAQKTKDSKHNSSPTLCLNCNMLPVYCPQDYKILLQLSRQQELVKNRLHAIFAQLCPTTPA